MPGTIRISKPLARHKFAYPGFAASPASCTSLLTRPYQCPLLRGSRWSALVCSTNDKLAADFVVIVIYIRTCAAWHSPQPYVNLATAHCCDVHRFKGPSNRRPLNICRDQLSQDLLDKFTASKPLQQLLRQAWPFRHGRTPKSRSRQALATESYKSLSCLTTSSLECFL